MLIGIPIVKNIKIGGAFLQIEWLVEIFHFFEIDKLSLLPWNAYMALEISVSSN